MGRTTQSCVRGKRVLQCLCIISSIIVQIHPSPTFQLPTMPEQWCSNKAILNDEHIYPLRWRVEALIEMFRAIQQTQTLNIHRWPHPAEGHCYKYTHSHAFTHVKLCNYMQEWATLIIPHLPNYMHVNLHSDKFFFQFLSAPDHHLLTQLVNYKLN